MPALTEEQLYDLNFYGERHYYYNEENYPYLIDKLSQEDILTCCSLLEDQILTKTRTSYNQWIKDNNNGEQDDKVWRSILEQYESIYCDCPLKPLNINVVSN